MTDTNNNNVTGTPTEGITVLKTGAVGQSEVVLNAIGLDEPKKKATQASINNVVAEAGGVTKLTTKQIEKEQKKHEAYMKSMITRQEAYELVQGALASQQQQYQTLLLSMAALADVLKSNGTVTQEQLTEATKALLEKVYNGPEEEGIVVPGAEQ